MREYIDSTDKANEIRLLFNHPSYKNKVIIVVEGSSDLRLFRDVYLEANLTFEPIDGKKDLLTVMQTLFPEFPEKLLAICDADHEHLMGTVDPKKEFGVYMTDYHDAEIMMMNSSALNSYISEYSQEEQIETIREGLLDAVLDSAYSIGLTRWANTEEGLNINFKGLNFNLFVDVNQLGLNVNLDDLFNELIRRSNTLNPKVNINYLSSLLTKYGSS